MEHPPALEGNLVAEPPPGETLGPGDDWRTAGLSQLGTV